jgi:LysR family transcriptional regulator, transcriptional activator of the cysJI operon
MYNTNETLSSITYAARMEIHQLETFETVVRLQSFTRAAEQLHLSQPAVTRQIAALEAQLRTRLFDRLGRTVQLTPAGELLHKYAQSIVGLVAEAKTAIADMETGAAGKLTVGASNTLATYVLPGLLSRFRAQYPRVEIAVHTGVSAEVADIVRTNDADLGLVTAEVRDAALLEVPLSDYDTCVVVPPGHALAAQKEIRPSDIADHPLILMEPGTNLRTYVDRLLSSAGVEEQVTLELDNVEAIKRMIEAGLGISMLPEVAVASEVEEGRLAALYLKDVPQANRRITLVYRKDKYITAAMRAFIAVLSTLSSAVAGRRSH